MAMYKPTTRSAMTDFTGTLPETLWDDGEFILARDIGRGPGLPPLLVRPASPEPQPATLAKLRHMHALRSMLDSSWAVRPIDFDERGLDTVLVLDGCEADVLARLVGQPWPLAAWLRVAIGIASALARAHAKGLVHKDVRPANLLVNPQTGEAWLAGFGVASLVPRERAALIEVLDDALNYTSPEQTGRTDHSIDARSDLYSLGVVLYEMLTGERPFKGHTALELIHAHLAMEPAPLDARVNGLPEPVRAIVGKLLAKSADERYQTAAGLEADLRRCLAEYASGNGTVGTFALGESDVSDRLLIPEKLYGREAELRSLVDAFDDMANRARPGVVLLAGYSGAGKSSVVNEFRKVLGLRRAVFAAGKFDQYMRDIPYATLVQVIRQLLKHALGMPPHDVAQCRAKLLAALGGHGRLIVDLVPELEMLIGEQPALPELPANEAQVRFQRALIRFLSVFATRERPLVLFLDDLQWLDAATLDLLGLLAAQREARHLLLIGAYRDNEVGPNHPLAHTLESMRAGGAAIRQMDVAPLGLDDAEALLGDTLRTSRADAHALAALVYEKTGGNPLFMIQFLYEVADDRLIALDSETRTWRWNIEGIRAKAVTDNVLDLMTLKLSRLTANSQRLLAMLACLGTQAPRDVLAALCETNADSIDSGMIEAVAAGFVLRTDGGFAFVHDRVQEAAYELIPAHQRAAEHLRIARILAACRQGVGDERLFDIVSHYDRALHLVTDADERKAVARLNLAAGQRARRATAYASALGYLRIGRDLLPPDAWQTDYRLAFDLEASYAESEFLTGDPETAETALAALAARAATPADDATAAWLRITLYTAMSRPDSAVQTCLEYVGRLGIDWCAHPGRQAASDAYARLIESVGGRPIEALIDLPPLEEPAHRTMLDVLTAVLPPAFFTDQDLVCLVLCHMATLSVVHGHSDASPLAYAYLGMVLGPCFGDYRAGYQFGRLGLALVDTRGIDRFRARVYMCFAYHVSPWTHHINTERALLERAFEAANEAGDLTYRGFSSCTLVTTMLAAGDPLDAVERVAQARLALMREAKFGLIVEIMTTQRQFVRALRGLTHGLASFDDDEFDERVFEQRLTADRRLDIATCWHWIRKLQLLCYAGDYASALDASERAASLLWTSSGHIEHSVHGFYTALALAAHHDDAAPEARDALRQALAGQAGQVQAWARQSPANYLSRDMLLSAELARLDGRHFDAMQLYERAAECAHAGGFVSIEALANERAARFCLSRGLRTSAQGYLRAAHAAYGAWGADGKVAQLEREHPELARTRPPLAQAPVPAPGGGALELATVMTTSQALTSEAALDKLIHILMELVLEHGGAQHGVLVLPRAEALWIAAHASVKQDRIETTIDPAPVDQARLPVSVLHYAMRTQESALLADAKDDQDFASDGYFHDHNVRSALCMPLVRQKRTIGMLYLENNLAPGVFTPSRLAILKLIASQAAISLENATLAEKQALIDEKDALLKEVHHRVKNNLQLVSSLLNLQASRVSDSTVSQLLVESRNRVRSMALVHENLYRAGNFSRVSMAAHIRNLCHHLASAYGTAARRIELVTQLDDVQLDLPRAVSCGLIVNELVSNALKHAFSDGRGGRVTVKAALSGTGLCELSVSDDGEGLPADFQQRQEDAMGMQLVHDLAAQLHGRVEAVTGDGATFTIVFPVAAPRHGAS